MPSATHTYALHVTWTGNLGPGTTSPRAYRRDTETTAGSKPLLAGSSDPSFRGDPGRWNPEELLLASLSQCHLLWYLDLAARAGVVVVGYVDEPTGTMAEQADGAGQFTAVTLRPVVTVSDVAMRDKALALHADANAMCFIARSVNFPVHHEATVRVAEPSPGTPSTDQDVGRQ
jgi:organic hydroperoxide reductase OsmC/OhrA